VDGWLAVREMEMDTWLVGWLRCPYSIPEPDTRPSLPRPWLRRTTSFSFGWPWFFLQPRGPTECPSIFLRFFCLGFFLQPHGPSAPSVFFSVYSPLFFSCKGCCLFFLGLAF
jgi:hypothetical protein